MTPQVEWVESLSPWPEEFGLGRMHALLHELGEPQRAYPSIHVVGTNGKSTAVRRIEALLHAEGLVVGAYLSPHVRGWSERIRVDGEEADFEEAVARVRPAAEAVAATQFEVLTAAALAAFAAAHVDVAVVEAGLGGRLDATNVLDAPLVVLTNVELDHTDVLGETREAIADEKLAVVQPGATVVLGEAAWEARARGRGAADVIVARDVGHAAAEAFLRRAVEREVEVELPGRLELRGEHPLELWDGAHNPAGVRWLVERAEVADYVVVASILRDKDAPAMLRELGRLGSRFIATTSSNVRALTAHELARLARPFFEVVEPVEDAVAALERARELAGQAAAVVVTGSLYLLQELSDRLENVRWGSLASG